MKFAMFMATVTGRALRIGAGAVLVLAGLLLLPWGALLALVGALVLVAGVANWCFIAPLLGVPFRASDLPTAPLRDHAGASH